MKTILAVDNAYPTLLMLKDEFERAGYEVVTTDSGKEALEILNNPSKPVNLVITNLRHSGPHTLDFIWLIKRNWPDLPVICHSALFEYNDLPPHDRPFDAFVEKSSDLTKLKNSVAKLIDRMG
jgi:DNA-binding NtrC family response regulator